MLISGIQKFTMLDFPEKTACIVFTAGCNFRCGYCHNPEFVLPEKLKQIAPSFIKEDVFFSFLDKRKNMLDGVVITGGEPTVMGDLPKFIQKIKSRGFMVKLDTNGNNPRMLKQIIDDGLVDYIAMDVKTDLENYTEIVGKCVRPEWIKKSVDMIMNSGIDYEFRSTLIEEIHPDSVIENMVSLIEGASTWYLQPFRSGHTLDAKYMQYKAPALDRLEKIRKTYSNKIQKIFIR